MALMEYIIVKESSSYTLIKRVEYWIGKGWKPQGGVTFAADGGFGIKETWVQAMVKE
jgi:hypothetical protein